MFNSCILEKHQNWTNQNLFDLLCFICSPFLARISGVLAPQKPKGSLLQERLPRRNMAIWPAPSGSPKKKHVGLELGQDAQ